MEAQAQEWLQKLESVVVLTGAGQVTLLRNVGSAEEFVVTCLVAQNLAQRAGRTQSDTMSVDEMIAAGGLVQSVARQTVYNVTSALAKRKIIQKRGNEFCVDERIVLQYVAAKLPLLTGNESAITRRPA
jgi:hypothetical protein